MLHGIDDLSIEELQNQLQEIQKRIKEKEKDGLIEKISASLRDRDLVFIQEVQAIVDGKKSLERASRKEKQPSIKPFKIGKTEVYLRQGKVFFGIQEIKYTRLDKNNILRISKEGKGLPPKVSSLPPHIQKVVLALPQKNEPQGSDPAPLEDPDPSQPAPTPVAPLEAPLPAEPEPAPEPVPAGAPAPFASPEPSVDIPYDAPEAPPSAAAAVRKRKPAPKTDHEATEDQASESVPVPEAAPPVATRAKEPVVSLQESLF